MNLICLLFYFLSLTHSAADNIRITVSIILCDLFADAVLTVCVLLHLQVDYSSAAV